MEEILVENSLFHLQFLKKKEEIFEYNLFKQKRKKQEKYIFHTIPADENVYSIKIVPAFTYMHLNRQKYLG